MWVNVIVSKYQYIFDPDVTVTHLNYSHALCPDVLKSFPNITCLCYVFFSIPNRWKAFSSSAHVKVLSHKTFKKDDGHQSALIFPLWSMLLTNGTSKSQHGAWPRATGVFRPQQNGGCSPAWSQTWLMNWLCDKCNGSGWQLTSPLAIDQSLKRLCKTRTRRQPPRRILVN